jgi:hypothetical protein
MWPNASRLFALAEAPDPPCVKTPAVTAAATAITTSAKTTRTLAEIRFIPLLLKGRRDHLAAAPPVDSPQITGERYERSGAKSRFVY